MYLVDTNIFLETLRNMICNSSVLIRISIEQRGTEKNLLKFWNRTLDRRNVWQINPKPYQGNTRGGKNGT